MSKMKFFVIAVLAILPCVTACKGNKSVETDWQKVIASYKDDGKAVNYHELAKLNLALAETGRLAEDVFKYTQAGSAGLIPEWNRTNEVGTVLGDVYWSMGHVAYAQRMYFEALVVGENERDPYLLTRLVQTNLVLGAYRVAEKYISILENDGFDCSRYKPLLYDDSAVDSDPELGPKRRCVPIKDHISLEEGLEEDLKVIIRQNPSYRNAVDYLGVLYLLECNMDGFRGFLDEFYGTEALPKLPKAFAEAACMLSQLESGYWKKVGVDKRMWNDYRDFKTRIETRLSLDKYKGTFWYYILRANNQ